MSEETPEKDEHGCVIGKEKWNGEACVKIEPVEKAGQDILHRVMGVMEEVMKTKLNEFEAKIDDKMEALLKQKEVEVELALRKSFGLENDPEMKRSEVIAMVRKMQLEATNPEKRSPASDPLQKGSPDGQAPTKEPFTDMVKEFESTGVKAK